MKYTVRTQTYEIADCTLDNIEDAIHTMIQYEDEFIVVSASEKINGISFLQATMHGDNIIFHVTPSYNIRRNSHRYKINCQYPSSISE